MPAPAATKMGASRRRADGQLMAAAILLMALLLASTLRFTSVRLCQVLLTECSRGGRSRAYMPEFRLQHIVARPSKLDEATRPGVSTPVIVGGCIPVLAQGQGSHGSPGASACAPQNAQTSYTDADGIRIICHTVNPDEPCGTGLAGQQRSPRSTGWSPDGVFL